MSNDIHYKGKSPTSPHQREALPSMSHDWTAPVITDEVGDTGRLKAEVQEKRLESDEKGLLGKRRLPDSMVCESEISADLHCMLQYCRQSKNIKKDHEIISKIRPAVPEDPEIPEQALLAPLEVNKGPRLATPMNSTFSRKLYKFAA